MQASFCRGGNFNHFTPITSLKACPYVFFFLTRLLNLIILNYIFKIWEEVNKVEMNKKEEEVNKRRLLRLNRKFYKS